MINYPGDQFTGYREIPNKDKIRTLYNSIVDIIFMLFNCNTYHVFLLWHSLYLTSGYFELYTYIILYHTYIYFGCSITFQFVLFFILTY